MRVMMFLRVSLVVVVRILGTIVLSLIRAILGIIFLRVVLVNDIGRVLDLLMSWQVLVRIL